MSSRAEKKRQLNQNEFNLAATLAYAPADQNKWGKKEWMALAVCRLGTIQELAGNMERMKLTFARYRRMVRRVVERLGHPEHPRS